MRFMMAQKDSFEDTGENNRFIASNSPSNRSVQNIDEDNFFSLFQNELFDSFIPPKPARFTNTAAQHYLDCATRLEKFIKRSNIISKALNYHYNQDFGFRIFIDENISERSINDEMDWREMSQEEIKVARKICSLSALEPTKVELYNIMSYPTCSLNWFQSKQRCDSEFCHYKIYDVQDDIPSKSNYQSQLINSRKKILCIRPLFLYDYLLANKLLCLFFYKYIFHFTTLSNLKKFALWNVMESVVDDSADALASGDNFLHGEQSDSINLELSVKDINDCGEEYEGRFDLLMNVFKTCLKFSCTANFSGFSLRFDKYLRLNRKFTGELVGFTEGEYLNIASLF